MGEEIKILLQNRDLDGLKILVTIKANWEEFHKCTFYEFCRSLEHLSIQTISTCKNCVLKLPALAHVEITCHFQSGGSAMDWANVVFSV